MSGVKHNIIEKRRKKITKRLKKRSWKDQSRPMIRGSNLHYDIDGRHSGISCGGIGIIQQMVQKIGLPALINSKLELLKRHLPYHESDHILNIYGSPQSQDKIWIKLSYKIDFSSFFSSPVFVEYLHASDKLPVPFRRIGQRWEATRAPGKAAEV